MLFACCMLQPLGNVALPVVSCNYLAVDDGMDHVAGNNITSVAAHISGHLHIRSIMVCINLVAGYAAVSSTSDEQ